MGKSLTGNELAWQDQDQISVANIVGGCYVVNCCPEGPYWTGDNVGWMPQPCENMDAGKAHAQAHENLRVDTLPPTRKPPTGMPLAWELKGDVWGAQNDTAWYIVCRDNLGYYFLGSGTGGAAIRCQSFHDGMGEVQWLESAALVRHQGKSAAKRKIYLASSWRNAAQPWAVRTLREAGHEVYDFRNPETHFKWSDIDEDWGHWTAGQYAAALDHPLAEAGFKSDMDAMRWADLFVLVLPCGRSAHLELGWAVGQGLDTAILLDNKSEPELMVKMVGLLTPSIDVLIDWIKKG